MKKTSTIGLLGAVLVLMTGCGFLDIWKKPPPPPVATQAPVVGSQWLGTRFEDIPIPQEFTLDYEASYLNVSEAGPRVADLRYTGKTSLTDVLSYVQRGMQEAGWRSTSLTGVAIKSMRYVKQDEECEVVIHKGGGNGSIIMVRLHPRP